MDVTAGGTTATVVTLARAGTPASAETPEKAGRPSTIYMNYRGACNSYGRRQQQGHNVASLIVKILIHIILLYSNVFPSPNTI